MTADVDSRQVVIFSSDGERKPYDDELDLLGGSPGGLTTVGTLRKSIGEFMPGLGAILEDVKAKARGQGLTQVSVALGVNAKGTVGFLGTGAEAGGTASLTLKFKAD